MLELTGIYDGIEMTMTHNQPIRVVVEISSQSETLEKSAVSPNVHNALNLYKVYRPYRLGVRGQFKENKAYVARPQTENIYFFGLLYPKCIQIVQIINECR